MATKRKCDSCNIEGEWTDGHDKDFTAVTVIVRETTGKKEEIESVTELLCRVCVTNRQYFRSRRYGKDTRVKSTENDDASTQDAGRSVPVPNDLRREDIKRVRRFSDSDTGEDV